MLQWRSDQASTTRQQCYRAKWLNFFSICMQRPAACQAIKPGTLKPRSTTYLVWWITENYHPVWAVEDQQLHILLSAGCPFINLPSCTTCSCDIIAEYKEAHKVIVKLLQDMPSCLHFNPDTWTSPNHCAFIAWTVQFDIVEVPKVHILFALWIYANGFQVSYRCHPCKSISGHAAAKQAHWQNTCLQQWQCFF